MLSYVMVGSADVKRAVKFYTAALEPLGFAPGDDSGNYVAFGPKGAPDKAQFLVTKPFNGKPASAGNGTMITLVAPTRKAVDAFHAASLTQGGTDEGKPGLRPADGNDYYAYVRDQDGNKICAHCAKAE